MCVSYNKNQERMEESMTYFDFGAFERLFCLMYSWASCFLIVRLVSGFSLISSFRLSVVTVGGLGCVD